VTVPNLDGLARRLSDSIVNQVLDSVRNCKQPAGWSVKEFRKLKARVLRDASAALAIAARAAEEQP
jgi:hypothetical protein